MSWMGRWALVALAWAAQGCYPAHDMDGRPLGPLAGEGVVRVELAMPSPLPDFRFVRVEAVDAEHCPFDSPCPASDDAHVFPLDASNAVPCAMVYGDTPQSVNVLVRLCGEDDCQGADDVDYFLSIERPFYPGMTTVVRQPVEAVPLNADPTVVARCEVEGCFTGHTEGSYCLLSGEHFCEADAEPIERPSSCTSEHAISIALP